jgi:hypothetical protein
MAFTGNEDHTIDLETASEWTANYRQSIPTSEGDKTIGHFFAKDHLQRILDQDNCVGLRIYYALNEAGEKQLIITGVKANEDDLHEGILAENSLKSPPYGGITNPLNS